MASKSTDARDARLNALVDATHAWADKRRTELNHRVDSSKAILQGRTGSERLAQSTVQAASALVASSIDDFLVAP